jgi:hypothetical protein
MQIDSAKEATMVIEEDQRLTECRLHRGPYLGDISALCFLHLPNHSLPLLLAGILFFPSFSISIQ